MQPLTFLIRRIKYIKTFFEIIGELTLEGHTLACRRVSEGESFCVQGLTLKEIRVLFLKCRFALRVDLVTEESVSDIRHMYSYLMGAPCLKH